MKRVKTKQEMSNHYNKEYSCNYGLPLDKVSETHKLYLHNHDLTTDPHPFDSMDIKVRVTPKQSKKLQKKAFKMGSRWMHGFKDVHSVYKPEAEVLYIRKGMLTFGDKWDDSEITSCVILTYKQFMNGTVPKKNPEEKLMFKGHDVKVEGDQIIIGCKAFYRSEVMALLKIESACSEQGITLADAHGFIYDNKSKLGL